MAENIILRAVTGEDGPALAGLSYSSPDAGGMNYAANYQIDAVQALQALHGDVTGAAAFTPDGRRLIGFGMVRFGRCQYEGELHPYALFGNLIVHPDYRRHGIGARLGEWQVAQAEERLGPGALLVANFQRDNTASLRATARWHTHAAGPLTFLPLKARPDEPACPPGLRAVPLEPNHYTQFCAGLNHFYRDANLFEPEDPASLAKLLARSPLDRPIRRAFAALDSSGRLVGGLVALEEYRLKVMEIHGLPRLLRLANGLVQIIPPDGAVREVYLDHLWHAPGHPAAARLLVEHARWLWREQATNAAVYFDPRGPLAPLFPTRPWTIHTRASVVVRAAAPMSRSRPIVPIY